MPLYALVDGERQRAALGGIRRAECADCGTVMIAKTGTTIIHHWAHEAEQPGCASAEESPWHLGWKSLGADGTQEITVGCRRADVLAPGGFAVEFQKSAMTPEEVWGRERDWKGRLVWVFDAQEAFDEGRLVLRRHPDRELSDAYRNVNWSHAPVRIKAAQCRSLLDLGDDFLLYVGRWYDSSPLQGYGWQVTRDWCTAFVVRGSAIPDPPGYQAPVDLERVARKATVRRTWQDRAWDLAAKRAAGRCRVLQAGREGCGCVTCHAELKHGTPLPLSAYPLRAGD